MPVDRRANPFTPGLGNRPPVLAGRDEIVESFEDALYNQNFDSTGLLLTGPRGIGKTALLDSLGDTAVDEGWLVIRTSGVQDDWKDRLTDTVIREYLSLSGDSGRTRMKALTIPVFGGGAQWEKTGTGPPQPEQWPLREVLRLLAKETKNGVAILIDEAQASNIDSLRAVGDDFQILARSEQLNIVVVLAALPVLDKEIERDNDKSTFLQRLDRQALTRLSRDEARIAVVPPLTDAGLEVNEGASDAIADAVEGSPYFAQLLGSELWRRAARDELDVITEAVVADVAPNSRAKYGKNVVLPQFDELSDVDKTFLFAAAIDDDDSRLSEIADRIGRDTNFTSQYRLRLIGAGLITPTGSKNSGTFTITDPIMRRDIRDLPQYQEFRDNLARES